MFSKNSLYWDIKMVIGTLDTSREYIIVVYDKGKDNDMTLKSKLISAYRKTGTDLRHLNEDIQHLKKHKSVNVYY